MFTRALLASAASLCLLTNCTPYEEIDREPNTPEGSTVLTTETTGMNSSIQDSPANGGAGEIDQSVAVIHKIRTKADVETSVTAMMALADEDKNGQLSMEEFRVISPALAQADNSITPSGEGGPVATPGAGENMESSTAEPIRREEFYSETAGADGSISSAELSTAINSRFDSADADGNGELTEDETVKFASSMLFSKE